MNGKVILITGATGQQGGAVVRQLLKRNFKPRALTRDPDKPAAQALRAQGVDVFKGDMEDVSSLRQAIKDAYGVFSVQNFWEKGIGYAGEIRQARNLAQMASDAGVTHFVQSSIAGCNNAKGVEHFESKWEIEKLVGAMRLPCTFVRTVFFMENFIRPPMATLAIPALAGALSSANRLHMISVEDVGWFVAEAFSNPAAYLGTELEIAGDSLNVAEIKEIYARVTGKRPSNMKFPAWLLRLLNAESAKQFKWNNEVGWHFDVQKLRDMHPGLLTFEQFLKAHLS